MQLWGDGPLLGDARGRDEASRAGAEGAEDSRAPGLASRVERLQPSTTQLDLAGSDEESGCAEVEVSLDRPVSELSHLTLSFDLDGPAGACEFRRSINGRVVDGEPVPASSRGTEQHLLRYPRPRSWRAATPLVSPDGG